MNKPTVLGYIKEQPSRLQYVLKNAEVFTQPFEKVFKENSIKKIIFFGSGTSYNVSQIAAFYFKQIVGVAAEAQYPTVFQNYERADWTNLLDKKQILFVGISQSGTSISTVNVMKYAHEQGYPTLALTGDLESEITNYVDVKVHLLVGDELTPPETKGYTVSVLTVYLWALTVSGKYEEGYAEVEHLVNNFQKVIDESEKWYEGNKATIVNSDRLFVLGYGVDYGSALEAQLKMGEMLRLPALGYEIEEYSHGPTMALKKNQTIFMIGSDEPEFSRMLQFYKAFKKYSSRIHIISCMDIPSDSRNIQFSIKVNKYLAPIMYTVPFQFVAAKGARDIGIDTTVDPFKEPLSHFSE